MNGKSLWILVRVLTLGVFLAVGLCWFVNLQMATPQERPEQEEVETLLTRLARKANVTERQVKIILHQLGPAMARELAKGNKIHLPGLGDFQIESSPNISPQDQQGNQFQLMPAGHSLKFSPSKGLQKRIQFSTKTKQNRNSELVKKSSPRSLRRAVAAVLPLCLSGVGSASS